MFSLSRRRVTRYPSGGYETLVRDTPTELPREYQAEHVRQALAADPRVSALGLEIEIGDAEVWVRGLVATKARRDAALEIVRAACGECVVRDGLEVVSLTLEPDEEQLR